MGAKNRVVNHPLALRIGVVNKLSLLFVDRFLLALSTYA